MQIAYNVSKTQNGAVVYLNIDRSNNDLFGILALQNGKFKREEIFKRKFEPAEIAKIYNISKEIGQASLFVENETSVIEKFIDRCKIIDPGEKIRLIVVDSIQQLSNNRGFPQDQFHEVSLHKLKLFAKSINCAVLVLSNLPFEIYERESKSPQLSDLQATPAIRDMAHLVLMLNRYDAYYPDTKNKNTILISVEKNKDGMLGAILYKWDDEHLLIEDY